MEIRLAREDDLEGIGLVVNHFIEHGVQHLGTATIGERHVRQFALHPAHPCFVAVSDSRVLGVAWSAPHKSRGAYAWAVDVAIYLLPDAWGRGDGARLQARVVDCVRRQGYVSALAIIVVPNDPSVRLHERLGFRPVGVMPNMGFKHGAWRDVGIWHLGLRTTAGDPSVVLPVRSVLGEGD